MSFEIGMPLGKNIRTIVRTQLKHSIEVLTCHREHSQRKVVHDLRKTCKSIRALLRLIRPAMAEKTFASENCCFRDIARAIAHLRDSHVVMETLDKVTNSFENQIADQGFKSVRMAIVAFHCSNSNQAAEEQNVFVAVAQKLQNAKAQVRTWSDVPNRWSSIGHGLEETYRQASKLLKRLDEDSSAESLHEWRKHVKYLHYQLSYLQPLSLEFLKDYVVITDRIGMLLGDDHDLAILQHALADNNKSLGDASERDILVPLIDRRRVELANEAISLGREFFVDRPKKFVCQFKKSWHKLKGH